MIIDRGGVVSMVMIMTIIVVIAKNKQPPKSGRERKKIRKQILVLVQFNFFGGFCPPN